MRALSPLRWRRAAAGSAILGSLLVAGMFAMGTFGSTLGVRTYTVLLLNVALVVAIQIFIGDSGVVSFGHVAFMGVGAYLTALLTIPPAVKALQVPGLPAFLSDASFGLPASVLIAVCFTALIAAVVGLPLSRMTESAMAMGTLALLVVAHTVFQQWQAVTRGTLGLYGIPRATTPLVAASAAVFVLVIARLYKESPMGLRVRATREDPLSAGAVGIRLVRARYGAWVLSAALMGGAGSLWAQNVIAFDPGQFFFSTTFALLAMLVVGGRGSVSGAALGAVLITLLTDTLSRVEQGVAIGPFELPRVTGTVNFVIAFVIIGTLIWKPEGLFGYREIDEFLARWKLFARWWSPRGVAAPELSKRVVASDGAALEASGVEQRFQGLVALDGVELTVRSGEILGLIGPNGSGKTTLLNAVSGVIPPDAGRVIVSGTDVTGLPAPRISDLGLARTFQNIRLFSHLTVRDNVEAGAPPEVGPDALESLLAYFGLSEVADVQAASLPYGAQRRVEIARAAVRAPSVLLLDEPAAGMNETESDELLVVIRGIRDRLGCAVVVVDHDLRLILRLCDRIQVLDQGRTIALGAPTAVAEDPRVIEAYLGAG